MGNFIKTQTMGDLPEFKKPAPFSIDDPHRQAEIERELAAKKARVILDTPNMLPTAPVPEKPPVDLSQLPPPHPSDRMPS